MPAGIQIIFLVGGVLPLPLRKGAGGIVRLAIRKVCIKRFMRRASAPRFSYCCSRWAFGISQKLRTSLTCAKAKPPIVFNSRACFDLCKSELAQNLGMHSRSSFSSLDDDRSALRGFESRTPAGEQRRLTS